MTKRTSARECSQKLNYVWPVLLQSFGSAFFKSVQLRVNNKGASSSQTRKARAKRWEEEELSRKELAEQMLSEQKKEVDTILIDSADEDGDASCSDDEAVDVDIQQRAAEAPRNLNKKRSRSSDEEEESESKKKKRKPTTNREKQWR
eukprot:1080100-Pyramimonas_sp.AAC.1